MIKKLFKEWSDILVFIPITVALIFGFYTGIHFIDPTAALIDLGTLSIFLLNALTYLCINGFAYLCYKINFSDYFKAGWTESLSPAMRAVVNLLLWFVQLAIAVFIFTRNL